MVEYTGKDVNYYLVDVVDPKRTAPYRAECEDIIEALQLTFQEACAFKAIWRSGAARLGVLKAGYIDGLYDAEKVEHYGSRMKVQVLRQRKRAEAAIVELNKGKIIGLSYEQVCCGYPLWLAADARNAEWVRRKEITTIGEIGAFCVVHCPPENRWNPAMVCDSSQWNDLEELLMAHGSITVDEARRVREWLVNVRPPLGAKS